MLPEGEDGSGSDNEKWEIERAFRAREVALKEREQEVREKDLTLRQAEAARSAWRSPVVVAILAATVAALGNGVVALVNGQQSTRLEDTRAEAARILEMIKTGDADKAATNLRFLADAGLISDPNKLEAVRHFLKTRQPGQGPSLPASPTVGVQPTRALPSSDPLRPLTAAIGQLRTVDQNTRCTAFRVASDLILTAYHCVDLESQSGVQLLFSPLGTDGMASPEGIRVMMPPVEVLDFPGEEPNPEDKNGALLLRLETSDRSAENWLSLTKAAPAPGTRLAAITFLGSPDQLISRGPNCSVIEVRASHFSHRCELGPGSSGAPLLAGEDFRVIGLHFAFNSSVRWAVRVDQLIARSPTLQRLTRTSPQEAR